MRIKNPGMLFFLLLVFVVRGANAGISGHASHPHTHKKFAKLKNPVLMSEESIKSGKAIFEKNCAACHGKDANGGTGPDLTDGQWIHGLSDGEIFHVISDGVAGMAMKGFKNELSEEIRWDIVNYIRSVGKRGHQ